MNKVLVTGANGFIGRHCLSPLLAAGYEVHAVSSGAIPADSAVAKEVVGVHWHHADLLDSSAIADLLSQVRPTHLLHFAWFVSPGVYWSSPENLRWVQASLELLQHFTRREGRRIVMAGTCAEYDWKYGYCSEAFTPLTPQTLYGTCKHSLQLMLSTTLSQTEVASAAWGRIFFPYGPHERAGRLVPSVIGAALKREPIRCSHGRQLRDFLYVQDVADAFVALLDNDACGPVNIGSGSPVAIRDVVFQIADRFAARDLVEFGALPSSPDEPPLLVADISRLQEEVGWSPRYDLENGLEQTIHWWRSRLDEK